MFVAFRVRPEFQHHTYHGRFALSAQPFRGEIIKIYPKDVDSVRFELSLSKQRIASLKGKFQFGTDFIGSLQKLIDLGFPKAANRFIAFINECTFQPETTHEIDSYIFRLHKSLREPSKFRSVTTKLVANGKVAFTKELFNSLKSLLKTGLVFKTQIGEYRITRENRKMLTAYLEFCKEYNLAERQNKHKTKSSRIVS